MISKSKARMPGGLTRHLSRLDTNEHVQFEDSRGVTPTLSEALEELAIRGATARGRRNLFHVAANPDPGETMTAALWAEYWSTFEAEFRLDRQPFAGVVHRKRGKLDSVLREHRHRVYSLVRDDGTLVSVSHNFRRNELVSRMFEVSAGQAVYPGRHHRWVLSTLRSRAGKVSQALVTPRTASNAATVSQAEFQQAERKLTGKDPRPFRAAVYRLFVEAHSDWRRFAAALDGRGITVAAGRSAILLVDEKSGFEVSLVRLLREEAKRNGDPLKITAAEVARAFGNAQPLADELQEVRRRRSSHNDQPERRVLAEEHAERKPGVSPAAPSTMMKAFMEGLRLEMVQLLARERSRLERLAFDRSKRNHRRASLDRRLANFYYRSLLELTARAILVLTGNRVGVRATVMVVAALAHASSIAPVLLAAAAIDLVRAQRESHDRAIFRADVDAAKAARSGFSFTGVPFAERRIYQDLARSAIFHIAGSDPTPALKALKAGDAARFIAWWAHASEKQRHVVLNWADRKKERLRGSRGRSGRGQ